MSQISSSVPSAPQQPDDSQTRLSQGDGLCLVVVYLAAFVAAFNENIVNVALPELCQDMGVVTQTGQWLITGYMVVASVMTALTGYLSRRFATRALFFCAMGCLVGGEALCFVAPSFELLLPCRLVQAVGSGILFPLMMNVVLALSPRSRLGLFLAIGSACITLGPATGPVLSGLADTLFGWRAIFVLPGVASLILCLVGVKAVRTVNCPARVRLDAPSLALLCAGLTVLVLGIGTVPQSVVLGVVLLAIGVVALGLFARRQLGLSEPLLDVRPFGNPAFWPAVLLTMVAMMMSFSLSVLLPLLYEGSYGTTSLVAGLLILPAVAVNAATSIAGGRVFDKHGAWPLLAAGMLLVCLGLVAMVPVTGASVSSLADGVVGAGQAVAAHDLAWLPVTVLTVVVYAGVGLVMSPAQTAGLRSLPAGEDQAGTAIINTSVMVAASIGSSLFVGVMSSATAGAMGAGVSEAVAHAQGFSVAMAVAAVIGACGLVGATLYSRRLARRAAEQR